MGIISRIKMVYSFFIYTQKKININNKTKNVLFMRKSQIRVLHGPFKGMKYPCDKAAGSALWPKLLGVYEKELQPYIYKSLNNEYDYIIDIGCAEGYYAVGYAINGKYNKVIAYDIDSRARKMCERMCKENGVNIDIRRLCTKETLESIEFDNKSSLIFIDCEGYERQLLANIDTTKLKNVSLIVEIHDWCQYETETSNLIRERFANTHKCTILIGCDDYDKAYYYDVPEINEFPIQDRLILLQEGRKRLGKWMILEPK